MKEKIPFFILILFSLIFIFSFYHKPILHPDNYLFGDQGDAIKNYFTYAYHIKHDSSYLDFEGMNYPYGENFLYTDCQPVLASFLKSAATKFPFISAHSIGILNFILILSVFLTFFISYFLLKAFNINNWLSLLFSIGITLLAPQIFRIDGHFALSYSMAIPLSWLILVKYYKTNGKSIYLIILFMINLFWLFIHAYLGIIILAFLAVIAAAKLASDIYRKRRILQYLYTFTAIFLPVVIFYVFAILTDNHTGRTNNPSGFFLYNAEPDDVFLPHHPPLRPLLDKLTGNSIRQEWEAWSYVGFFTTILFTVIMFLLAIKTFWKGKSRILNDLFSYELLNISLLSAFIVLLFAMAFPFKLIPGMLDHIPVLKQFRATGRFAWPFFFAATVFAVKSMQEFYMHFSNRGRKTFAISLCIVAGMLNIAEGLPYHWETSEKIVRSGNLFNKELLSDDYQNAIQEIKPGDFQAIITLPFYYLGSESYSRPRFDETMRVSICLSYHTGIPLVNANLTRTSVQESKKIVQLVSPGFYKKEIENDLEDERPFLLIRTKDPVTDHEMEILKKCRIIYPGNEISLFELNKADLFTNNSRDYFDKYNQNKDILSEKYGLYLADDSSFLYYNNFDHLLSLKPFHGNGGFQTLKKGKNTLAEFDPNTFAKGIEYHVSVWMYNGFNDALNDWFRFIIEEYDEDSNKWTSTTYFPEQSEVINGDWSLIEGTFKINDPGSRIYIVTKGKEEAKQDLFIDDLLIREAGVDVYKLDETRGHLFFNNNDIFLQQEHPD